MKREARWALIALAVVCAASAMAGVAKGGKLYIKGTGVSMWDKPEASGKKTALKNGDEVTWNGPSEKDKSMHEVMFKNKKGFVQMANLTPNKPADEVTSSDGKTTSAQAFASSGAATKAMSESGIKYAKGEGPSAEETAAGLIHLEGSSEEQKKNIADHVKKAGLGGEK
ncbi:MAG: hypothetical protein IPJ65_34080 [Archangiaceae bacterium]|nr:hypothetical protein [Archangiaceae bacterium]